jgi:lipid II:glycine glycyltransferase (peptidoglycan interpeptide bridge formation enzyme)
MPASVFKAIETARDRGLKYFDFNGANSPDRGDNKHSYGAEPVLYFDIEYKAH